MVNVFLQLLFLLVFAIVVYRVLVQVICLYKGISVAEAEKKIHNFINDEPEYHLNKDARFCNAVDTIMQSCLTDEHYSRLEKLNNVERIVNYEMISGVHAIRIYILSYDLYKEEVNHLKARMQNIVKYYLQINGLPDIVQTEIINDNIVLLYAETQREKQIIENIALADANKIKKDAKKIEAYKATIK